MPHQCTKCGIVFPDAAEELLKGCSCGSGFFYYMRQEKYDSITAEREVLEKIEYLEKADKIQIEKDIREITGMDEEPDKPVILDLESVNVLGPGKFEIDIINLFSKKRPLIYRLEEGKYIIDLSDSYSVSPVEVGKKIRDPDLVLHERGEMVGDSEDVDERVDEDEVGSVEGESVDRSVVDEGLDDSEGEDEEIGEEDEGRKVKEDRIEESKKIKNEEEDVSGDVERDAEDYIDLSEEEDEEDKKGKKGRELVEGEKDD